MQIEEHGERNAEDNLQRHRQRNHDRAVLCSVPEQRIDEKRAIVLKSDKPARAARGGEICERKPQAVDERIDRKQREIRDAWTEKQPQSVALVLGLPEGRMRRSAVALNGHFSNSSCSSPHGVRLGGPPFAGSPPTAFVPFDTRPWSPASRSARR